MYYDLGTKVGLGLRFCVSRLSGRETTQLNYSINLDFTMDSYHLGTPTTLVIFLCIKPQFTFFQISDHFREGSRPRDYPSEILPGVTISVGRHRGRGPHV